MSLPSASASSDRLQRASFSVDLDPLHCYSSIHGLDGFAPALRDVVLRRGLPRFLDLLARRGIAGTFFVVAEDLDLASPSGTAEGIAELRSAVAAGHEIGSHSHTHPYALVRMDREGVGAEIDRAHALIESVLGVAPVGFRAPGYNLSATVVEHLVARGYCYDSSVLPAPLYYSAKAAVMGALALVARPSRSVLGDPRFLVAPGTPYRPDASAPWRRGQAPIIELPITVTPRLHVPVIGTYVVAAPRLVREHLVSTVLERPFFNFELHGIDLVDAEADEIPAALVAKQPDLRVPLDHKLAALEHALDRLAERFSFLTLADYAASFPG